MLTQVRSFCERVEQDLAGLVDDLQAETGRGGADERQAWMRSLPKLSVILAKAEIDPIHLHLGASADVSFEYRLPASSSWCDAILLGRKGSRPSTVILELKDWDLTGDLPGPRESLIEHKGSLYLHPSEQVRGYVEYCRQFHSAVIDTDAEVSGCVLFTNKGDPSVYRQAPHSDLIDDYPVFSTAESDARILPFLTAQLTEPDAEFAGKFVNGTYRQNRSFIVQVSQAIKESKATPYVLLDEQRRGFELCMQAIEEVDWSSTGTDRRVIIIEGPPGSGKSVIAANLWAELAGDQRLSGKDAGPYASAADRLTQRPTTATIMESRRTEPLKSYRGFSQSADEEPTPPLSTGGHSGGIHEMELRPSQNVVLTTTSASQKSNWEEMFAHVGTSVARGIVKSANQYNPGLSPTWVKSQREEGKSIEVAQWRENVKYFLSAKPNRSPDLGFAVSICDESHALIDPTVLGAEGVPPSGWTMHAGPQVFHIIRSSRVSIFLGDGEQSYRDNETTTRSSIVRFANELGVDNKHIVLVSLAGQQFRCGGSKAYVDWLEATLGLAAVAPHSTTSWRRTRTGGSGPFLLELVNDPQALEDALREHIHEGRTARLMATCAKKWVTKKEVNPHDLPDNKKDYHIQYARNGVARSWSKIWNYAPDGKYSLFIQPPKGSRMHDDTLCEIGCPYIVRGFDYDYLGVLWQNDLVWRDDRWVAQLENVHDTSWPRTRKAARDAKMAPSHPAVQRLVQRLARGYRILLSRAIRGVYLWVEDPETRAHLGQCLGESVNA